MKLRDLTEIFGKYPQNTGLTSLQLVDLFRRRRGLSLAAAVMLSSQFLPLMLVSLVLSLVSPQAGEYFSSPYTESQYDQQQLGQADTDRDRLRK